MKRLYVLLLTVVVGVAVALTYYVFESLVHVSIDFIWYHLFNTNENRLLIIPIGLAISLLYFYGVHFLDPKAEHVEEGGMGHLPPPTLRNFIRILFIGFLSLLAGASLGPEAILVPACMLLGAYISVKLLGGDKQMTALLSAAGFIALFAAFFNSFLVGLLSVLLVVKIAKIKLTFPIVLTAIVASGSAALTLWAIRGRGLIDWPPMDWGVSFISILGLIIIGLAGYGAVYLIRIIHDGVQDFHNPFSGKYPWWQNAIVASLGLSFIYLLAGPLVQFTGNAAIVPLVQDSENLGIISLIAIVLAKILAIAWSKAIGYRGGLIFPAIFMMTGIILIVNTFAPINYIYGLVFGFIGVFMADNKNNIMFEH